MTQHCTYIKENGELCGAYAVHGSMFCLNHEPTMQETKRAAVQKGGQATSYDTLALALPPLTIVNASDVVSAAIQTINEVRAGNLPPKVASTIGYLLGVALKGFEQSELQNRVQTIERVILERSTK